MIFTNWRKKEKKGKQQNIPDSEKSMSQKVYEK